jgi:hypothetical protein
MALGCGVWFTSGPLRQIAKADPCHGCEMKNINFAAELHLKLGAPASSTVESLRLMRAFLKLAPRQRFEVIKLVEDLATDESLPEHPLS